MAGKSIEKRIAEAEERIKQLHARKQTLANQLQAQERKERTRRLIQVGAIMAKLGVDTPKKAQVLQRAVEQQQEIRMWLNCLLNGSKERKRPHGVHPWGCSIYTRQ